MDVDVDVDVDDDMNAQSAVGTKKLSVGPTMQHLVHPIKAPLPPRPKKEMRCGEARCLFFARLP